MLFDTKFWFTGIYKSCANVPAYVCTVLTISVSLQEEDSEVVALPRLTKWTTVSDKGDEDS